MAERKKSKNKEIKIIREFVNVPFREIKKERTETEESLEEEAENEEDGGFEFPEFVAKAITPILQSTSETQTLERELEKTPAATTETAEQTSYESSVYNMPEYSYEKGAAPERKGMQHTGMLIRQDEIREIKPRAEMEEWHELKGGGQQTGARHAVVEAGTLDREMKLPFEDKRKYRKMRG
jgi:hypothetical protein